MKDNSTKANIHIRVWGRVQGVGFRAFVAQNAKELNLTGWVRNVGRDQVETRAEGTRKALDLFLEKVRAGSSFSNVKECEFDWGEFGGEYKKFKVRWF